LKNSINSSCLASRGKPLTTTVWYKFGFCSIDGPFNGWRRRRIHTGSHKFNSIIFDRLERNALSIVSYLYVDNLLKWFNRSTGIHPLFSRSYLAKL